MALTKLASGCCRGWTAASLVLKDLPHLVAWLCGTGGHFGKTRFKAGGRPTTPQRRSDCGLPHLRVLFVLALIAGLALPYARLPEWIYFNASQTVVLLGSFSYLRRGGYRLIRGPASDGSHIAGPVELTARSGQHPPYGHDARSTPR
jgi:hypothetical protein